MPDVGELATRLPKDKAYSRKPHEDADAPHTFVCPRADAYGGRDGVIPPGLAAERGLVPKGMRRIDPSETARTANAAAEDGKTEEERYIEYYGRGAMALEQEAARPSVPPPAPAAPAAPAAPPAGPSAARGGRLVPGRSNRPNRPNRSKGPARHNPLHAQLRPGVSPEARAPASTPPDKGVLRDPDDPGMFSREPQASGGGDTLDDFYESLGDVPTGTGEPDPQPKKAVFAGVDMGRGRSETVVGRVVQPAPGAPRAYGPLGRVEPGMEAYVNELVRLTAEKAELQRRLESLGGQLAEAQRQLDDAAARERHYAGLEQEVRLSRTPAETVRVPLAAEETKLKVGGRHWECNIVGALHMGRTGQSAVLTVSDPAYASELLAEIQPGQVVILSESKRTSCTYGGHCAKIYGEPDSPDFIAAFWLTPDGEQDTGG